MREKIAEERVVCRLAIAEEGSVWCLVFGVWQKRAIVALGREWQAREVIGLNGQCWGSL